MQYLLPFQNPIYLSNIPQKPHFNGTHLPSKPLSKRHSTSTNSSPQEDEDFRVLTATKTEYNNIVILETQTSKVLLLDDSCNVHSILYNHQKWTNSYWDEFTSLPAIIPPGPIAVFGLGGATIAHQMLHFWPTLCIHGWELDEILIDRARQFLGLSELELKNISGGILKVHIGDALSASATVKGGFAGIVVDLFSNAKVLPELEEVETWVQMNQKLMPNGRIMVNCGGDISSIQAMCRAFGTGFVNWKKMPEDQSGNYLAFTGQMPDIASWSNAVPCKLGSSVTLWRSCESV